MVQEEADGIKTPMKVPVGRGALEQLIKQRVMNVKIIVDELYKQEVNLRNQPKDKNPDKGGDAAFNAFLT